MPNPPPKHLIVVCCHAIWLGPESNDTPDENGWLVQEFQRGETPTFIKHIKAGCRLLHELEEDAVLVFSGGPTRKETRTSEAESYRAYAISQNLVDRNDPRVLCETLALDSYQNLLFSLFLFHKTCGIWPVSIHIVTHAFKRPRFLDVHCKALKLDLNGVRFIGIDPPSSVTDPVAVAEAERKNGFELWKADLYGQREVLALKRRGRDLWGVQDWEGKWVNKVTEGLGGDGDIVKRLVLWKGGQNGNEIFPERLPWTLDI